MHLPLYAETQDLLFCDTAHPGLVFDKFVDRWKPLPFCKPDPGEKQKFYEAVIERMNKAKPHLKNLLTCAMERRRELILKRGGKIYSAKTDGRLVVGLGSDHPFETGLTWHPTLGVPYLPGSSIKGMIRAWADPKLDKKENVWGWGDKELWDNNTDKSKALKRLFGDTDDFGVGSIIVFDALPVACPVLDVDIMTPHYGPYYRDRGREPPADWHSPVPIPFLTVGIDQVFEFALVPRRGNGATANQDLGDAQHLLKCALETLGIGGKTAVGYGRFKEFKDRTTEYEEQEKKEKQRQAKEAQAAARENLSGVERDLADLTWLGHHGTEVEKQAGERLAARLYEQLESASSEEQLKIAQALKGFYCRIGKWKGKKTSTHKARAQKIKSILGE